MDEDSCLECVRRLLSLSCLWKGCGVLVEIVSFSKDSAEAEMLSWEKSVPSIEQGPRAPAEAGLKGGVGFPWAPMLALEKEPGRDRSAKALLSVTTRAHSVTIWTMLSRARALFVGSLSRRSLKSTALNREYVTEEDEEAIGLGKGSSMGDSSIDSWWSRQEGKDGEEVEEGNTTRYRGMQGGNREKEFEGG